MTSRPLTILQMLPELNSGGVEKGTVEVSGELVRQGYRSIVMSSGGRLVEQILEQGGEHVQWEIAKKSPLSLRHVWALRKFLEHNQVDILHARSRVPAWIAYFAWRGMDAESRPKFVTTAHGLYSVNRYSEVMTKGEVVIAVSETVAEYVRENYRRVESSKIRTISRGIDPNDFPRGYRAPSEWLKSWEEEFPTLADRPVVSLIGRMTRYKGHHEFLKIIDFLRKEVPNVRGLIVGEEDPRRKGYAQELRDEVQKRGLAEHIIFAGHRSDVREIYSITDVMLAVSSNPPEAFGRTTIEALNMGVPVVGFDHGGTGEILRKVFPTGIIPIDDCLQAANVVKNIIEQKPEVPNGHPYLKETMLRDTISIYEELAA